MTQKHDAIVIGAGMGGAAAAYELTRRGLRVLLVEKGRSTYTEDAARGVAGETTDPAQRLFEGRWPTRLSGRIDGKEIESWPALGCGLGGSSTLYAATLERLDPGDFDLRTTPAGEQIGWPFPYATLVPHYQTAERLFGVRGDRTDPGEGSSLRDPVPMSEADCELQRMLESHGLSPYRLHVAIEYLPECRECGGHYCPKQCKRDSRNACVHPALETGRLEVLDETEVLSLEADRQRVHAVNVFREGRTERIEAPLVLLAAGALLTPVILQRSANAHWPTGIANDNGMVGRNLMFHAGDFFAIWTRKRNLSRAGARRSLGLRDFYRHGTTRLGKLQSTGLVAGYGNILYALRESFDRSPFRRMKPVRQLLRIPARIASLVLTDATVLGSIVEDHPYPDNRVVWDSDRPSQLRYEYRISDELRERIALFRSLLKTALKGERLLLLGHEINLNFGHACGTCRSGADPKSSVVDANCRVHGMDNLYVVDGSFMPTSGGVNPSLTIAANALRVASIVADRLLGHEGRPSVDSGRPTIKIRAADLDTDPARHP